jgi:hypothetical protein
MGCPCFELKEETLDAAEAPRSVFTTETLWQPEAIHSQHIGQWYLRSKEPYPGIMKELEKDNIQVKCTVI